MGRPNQKWVNCDCGKGYGLDIKTGEISKSGLVHLNSKFHVKYMKDKEMEDKEIEVKSVGVFENGKVYKLWSDEGGEIYIGSTTRSLEDRLLEYVSKYEKSKTRYDESVSNVIFMKYKEVKISVLEEYACNSLYELTKRRKEYERDLDCLNKSTRE
jgi:hypothetical protein